jgi:hypothetical protein
LFGKMANRGVYVRHFVAKMVGASAFFECAIHGRIWSKRGNEFYDRVSFSATEKAHRYVLNWIVKWAGFQFVVQKALVSGDCFGQISDRDPNMVQSKRFHRLSILTFDKHDRPR